MFKNLNWARAIKVGLFRGRLELLGRLAYRKTQLLVGAFGFDGFSGWEL